MNTVYSRECILEVYPQEVSSASANPVALVSAQFLHLRFATAFLAFGMHGQTGPSTPPAAPAAAPAATNGTQPAVHGRRLPRSCACSNLVVVDVVVTDSKKNPVHGLKTVGLHADGERQSCRRSGTSKSTAPRPRRRSDCAGPEAACRPVHQQVGGPGERAGERASAGLSEHAGDRAGQRAQAVARLPGQGAGWNAHCHLRHDDALVHAAGVYIGHGGVEGRDDVEEGHAAGLGHPDGPGQQRADGHNRVLRRCCAVSPM